MSFHVSFWFLFFSPFSIAITSLGEERATFRMFVRFVLVWICRFPLPLGVWEGLRCVIVALPGLFSYLFLKIIKMVILGVSSDIRPGLFSNSESLCHSNAAHQVLGSIRITVWEMYFEEFQDSPYCGQLGRRNGTKLTFSAKSD